MLRARPIFGAGFIFLASACRTGGNPDPAPTPTATVDNTPAPVDPPPPPRQPLKVTKTWDKSRGFKSPAAVLHDEINDLYLVTNKGFISKVAPAADGIELKWIESGKNGATLRAPKGMAFSGKTLYVADVDTVRLFDRATGQPTGEVRPPGAKLLDDIAVSQDNRLFVTDTQSDAVYEIQTTDKKVTTYAKAKELDHPKGLVWSGDKPYVVGSNELFGVERDGTKAGAQRLPKGKLDGILMIRSEFWVASWEGNAVYRGHSTDTFVPAIEDVKSPADLGYDRKRHRLLVPLLEEDEVRAYDLEPK